MKRSEAIKHIARAMQLPTISEKPSNYWLKYAEIALNTMERIGMHPPTIRDGAGGLAEYWEPEDEKK